MSKVYIVTEYGGSYEDKWESIYAVCTTRELAEQKKAELEYRYSSKDLPLEEEWDNISADAYNYAEEHEDTEMSFIEICLMLYPDLTYETIDRCLDVYDNYIDYSFCSIKEYDLIDGNNS